MANETIRNSHFIGEINIDHGALLRVPFAASTKIALTRLLHILPGDDALDVLPQFKIVDGQAHLDTLRVLPDNLSRAVRLREYLKGTELENPARKHELEINSGETAKIVERLPKTHLERSA